MWRALLASDLAESGISGFDHDVPMPPPFVVWRFGAPAASGRDCRNGTEFVGLRPRDPTKHCPDSRSGTFRRIVHRGLARQGSPIRTPTITKIPPHSAQDTRTTAPVTDLIDQDKCQTSVAARAGCDGREHACHG